MDNLTHSLVGALLGQMGLKRKTGLAMPTLIIAANIPDIDAVAVLLGGHQHLAIRRGITHGPIAMVLLPLLLWAAMLWFDRWQARRGTRPDNRLPVNAKWLLILAYIGCLSHPLFDWFNSYGIRLLEPFSSQWFYGDTLFIIDIWIWVALIAGVWLSLRRERRGRSDWDIPAWIGFVAISAYVGANVWISYSAETQAIGILEKRHPRFMSMPEPDVVANAVPVAFWKREILWRDRSNFGFGSYSLGKGVDISPTIRPYNMGNDIQSARQFPVSVQFDKGSDGAAFLFWSRMPFAELDGDAIVIRDQRFRDPRVGDRFSVKMMLPTQ
jgi:inner membrane protein